MQYTKNRYIENPHFSLLHIKGSHAGASSLPYLHYSQRYLLLYFKQGCGSIKIEGRNYHIHEGDIILLNPTELFRLYVSDDAYHERLSFSVSKELFVGYPNAGDVLLAPFTDHEKGSKNHIPAQTVIRYGLDVHLNNIHKHLKSSSPESPLLAFCEITYLLSALCKACATSHTAPLAVSNPLVGEVLDYLNLHFTENINIPQIALHFNIDKSYLSHLFKEYVGMSLWTYVVLRRIQLFNELIKANSSIEETCYKAGFQNYSNFFRLYKKHMNITPTEFKKQLISKKKNISSNVSPV